MPEQEPSAGRRVEWIDTLRGATVLLIVIFHAAGLQRFGRGRVPKIVVWFNQMSDPHWMPTLSFLSGFLSDTSSRQTRWRFYASKSRTMLYPYAVWTVVHAVVFRVALTPKWVLRLATGGTYLFFLPFLFVCNALGYELSEVTPAPVIAVSWAASGLLPARLPSVPERFTRSLPHLIGMFFIGRWAAENPSRWATVMDSGPLQAASRTATMSGLATVTRGTQISYHADWAWSPALALVSLSSAAQRAPEGRVTDALRFVGRNSLVYYTTHYPAAYVTTKTLARRGVAGSPPFFGSLLASLALPTGLALLRHRSRMVRRLFSL